MVNRVCALENVTIYPSVQKQEPPVDQSLSPEALQNRTLVGDSLDQIASLKTVNCGGPGQPKYVSVRGLKPNQTLVQLDDMIMNTSSAGYFDLGNLLKGSIGSAALDGDTLVDIIYHPAGSVLNLSLAVPSDYKKQLAETEIGSTKSAYTHIRLNDKGRQYAYVLHGEGYAGPGLPQRGPFRKWGELNPYSNGSFAAGLFLNPTPDVNIDVVARLVEAHLGSESAASFSSAPTPLPLGDAFYQLRFLRLKMTHDKGKGLSHLATLGAWSQRSTYKDAFAPEGLDNTQKIMARYGVKYAPRSWTQTWAGAEITQDSYGGKQADVPRVFISQDFKIFDRISLGGSVTAAHHPLFGSRWIHEVRGRFYIDPTFFLKSVYKTSLIYPTLQDLYGMKPYLMGNPNLKPETARTLEVGFEKSWTDFRGDILYFNTETANMIVGQSEGMKRLAPINMDMQTQGIETGLAYDRGALKARLSHMYVRPQSRNESLLSAHFPKNKANLDITFRVTDETRLETVWTFVGNRRGREYFPDHSFQERQLEAYVLGSFKVTHEPLKGLETYFRMDNILNQRYQDIPGYGALGRAFYVGLRLSF